MATSRKKPEQTSSKPAAVVGFLALVKRVRAGTTGRSENDLSSGLAAVLKEMGLHTVIDTRVSTGSRKRPDILGYVSEQDADLVLPAEVVIESKKPEEIEGLGSLKEAMLSDTYWPTKTYLYLKDNITRVQYFAFTTFTEFAVFPVSRAIRQALIAAIKVEDVTCTELRREIAKATLSFRLYEGGEVHSDSAVAWVEWMRQHFNPEFLEPIPLSENRNSVPIETSDDLERLAAVFATFAAGSGDPGAPDAGLFHSVRNQIGENYNALPPETKRDLLIFVMMRHPGLNTEQAEEVVREDVEGALDDFVAASIHSLLSRLFAVKVIEDVFCVDKKEPLIEEALWLFATNVYDTLTPEEIQTEIFRRIRGLKESQNLVVRRFANYGFFFNWIEGFVDPILFRSLVEAFSVHEFSRLEGDLLGRFYELYAQQVNRDRRKALGQYYTPLAVVQFMWHQASCLIQARGETERLTVLDPGMGSGTFLAEGARILAAAKIPQFWERLNGFDISAQVLGIANINIYMAVLSQLTLEDAFQVEDLHLYATDSLDYENGTYLRQILPLIIDDAYRAFVEQRVVISTKAKRQRIYRLVIGNPPYRNNSKLTLGQVARRFPRLLTSSVEHGGAQRRNIRDDYAWFVAAADYYVGDAGIICFILSDSFASHRSYEFFRAEVLKHYFVRQLVRLGSNVFQDVGYRTSFAIILLERRPSPLEDPRKAERIAYSDLRPLVDNIPMNQLGTPQDPRLMLLSKVARGETPLVVTTNHVPSPEMRFSFYPDRQTIARFQGSVVPIFDKDSEERLFIKKWPGIITAFDALLKGNTREELEGRLSTLFQLCGNQKIRGKELDARVTRWAEEREFNKEEIATLQVLAVQIQQSRITFNKANIKRTFSGSIPTDAKWYPPAPFVHYLYYEPAIKIPRNVNPGKDAGWGTMNQWREAQSHTVSPKLIFTTGSNPKHGYAAFVVDDEWYVKLHGGTSQQFNYTCITSPTGQARLDKAPDNLTPTGVKLFAELSKAGGKPDTLLHYVAGVWNSELAAELLSESGSSTRPGIKLPQSESELELVTLIAETSRSARDIARLIFYLPPDKDRLPVSVMEEWARRDLLKDFGFKRVVHRREGFQPTSFYVFPSEVCSLLADRLTFLEAQVNELVELLYA